jgi:hypothetical protein
MMITRLWAPLCDAACYRLHIVQEGELNG